jgi:hypothetical protein
MGAVPYLDCSGIGQLVLLHERVRQAGGTLALVNLGPRQMHALRVVRLLEVLRVFETWDEAWRWCVGIRGNSELVVGALAASSDADRSRSRQGLLLTVC